ncbi:MAG: DNA topoisomerase I, partial [Clostridiales bacterium]|nr:DNA topoisomerase I [Clostridiales bacterium]
DLEGIYLKVPDEVSEEKCDLCGRNMVIKSGRFGRFLACPGYPECKFTKPLVVEMPGRCPKCGGRLMKRVSTSKRTGKPYTYYCCEHTNSADPAAKCDFMTFDVPVKDDCPVCGHTLFKKSGKGFKKPYCINPDCANFLPEDKRGYVKKKPADDGAAAEKPAESDTAPKPAAKKETAKKTAAKKPAAAKTAAAKKPAVKKSAGTKATAAKKPAAKKTAAKTATAKKPAARKKKTTETEE